jgi:hypothetical protein
VLPRVGRKSKREGGGEEEDVDDDCAKRKKKGVEAGKGDEDKKKAGKWEDAVAPEVKSEMSREEKKLQAEMERFQKLEAKFKGGEVAAASVAGGSGSGGADAGGEHRGAGVADVAAAHVVAAAVMSMGKKINSPSHSSSGVGRPKTASPLVAAAGELRSLSSVIAQRHAAAAPSASLASSSPDRVPASSSPSKFDWPTSVYMLKPGVNDSWNSYQVLSFSFSLSLSGNSYAFCLSHALCFACVYIHIHAPMHRICVPKSVRAYVRVYLLEDTRMIGPRACIQWSLLTHCVRPPQLLAPPQAANRGKQATVGEWKTARQALRDARDALIARAGPSEKEMLLRSFG